MWTAERLHKCRWLTQRKAWESAGSNLETSELKFGQENRGLYLCTYIRNGIQEHKQRLLKFMRSDEATSMKQMSEAYYGPRAWTLRTQRSDQPTPILPRRQETSLEEE